MFRTLTLTDRRKNLGIELDPKLNFKYNVGSLYMVSLDAWEAMGKLQRSAELDVTRS